jgi:hypothetical protein
MLSSFFYRMRYWPPIRWLASFWQKLRNRWFMWEKENFLFFSLFGFGIALIGSAIYFVYADHLRIRWQQQRQADLMCLARNVYHESRGEPVTGQYAVAEVTLNRVDSRHFPDTVCEVVYEKRFDSRRNRLVGAFSWTEFDSVAQPRGIEWQRARKAAEAIYDKQHEPAIPGALFYHADSIEPRWAKTKNRIARIGSHIFYE